MSYKRLTEKENHDGYVEENCGNCHYYEKDKCSNKDCYEVIKRRLCELEDKIENGTLIELPCKVGDTVYMPWVYDGVSGMAILIVEDIHIRNKYIKTNLESDFYSFLAKYNFGVFSWEAIGKTVFLTKPEAEQRLKELKVEYDNGNM